MRDFKRGDVCYDAAKNELVVVRCYCGPFLCVVEFDKPLKRKGRTLYRKAIVSIFDIVYLGVL